MRKVLEDVIGASLVRKWALDGAGPARYGWYSVWPCKLRWEGRTLAEVAARRLERAVGPDVELSWSNHARCDALTCTADIGKVQP